MYKKTFFVVFLISVVVITISLCTNAKNKTRTAKQILTSSCSVCHGTPDPSKYSVKKWKHYVEVMSKKAKISDDEKQVLLDLRK